MEDSAEWMVGAEWPAEGEREELVRKARYNSQQSCFRRCRCPCDGFAVGRIWYTPDRAELDTYEPPETPYDDQCDMEDHTEDMDDEWEVYHQLLQD